MLYRAQSHKFECKAFDILNIVEVLFYITTLHTTFMNAHCYFKVVVCQLCHVILWHIKAWGMHYVRIAEVNGNYCKVYGGVANGCQ